MLENSENTGKKADKPDSLLAKVLIGLVYLAVAIILVQNIMTIFR